MCIRDSAYTGGGGGGGLASGGTGGAGGSGVVIISYANPVQLGRGGDIVTNFISGTSTYWLHIFTATNTTTNYIA